MRAYVRGVFVCVYVRRGLGHLGDEVVVLVSAGVDV
jgi:hypothetical protein